jgi:enoyl-CoA hydratase/carnithine racemase
MAAWGEESGHVEVAVRDGVAVVTLRRPDKLNALSSAMRRELAAIFRYFGDASGAGAVRGLVVTGTGRAFSAGMDLREAADLPPGGLVTDVEMFHDLTRAALRTRVPVVAALNGIAVGGACEMTLCFDARIGTPTAEYFLPENNIVLTISNASSVLLPRLVGHVAMRLVMESARIDAEQALLLGRDPGGQRAGGRTHRAGRDQPVPRPPVLTPRTSGGPTSLRSWPTSRTAYGGVSLLKMSVLGSKLE